MGMTLAEKIFAVHAKRESVRAGELVFADVDMVMGTEVTVPLSIKVFREMGAQKVFDPLRVVLVNDHFVPAKDIQAALLSQTMRRFAGEQNIENYFEVGRSGICHILVPDNGLVLPGELVVGADSHTCTYGAVGAFATGVGSTDMAASWALGKNWFRVPETIKIKFKGMLSGWTGAKDMILEVCRVLGVDGAIYRALEFEGEAVSSMSMAGRFTICNMAIEVGAKSGIIAPDSMTIDYVKLRAKRKFTPLFPDPDARYEKELEIETSNLCPLVAAPFLPSNVKPAREFKNVKIDQVVIGSCTNGRIEDFRVAAEVIGDEKIHNSMRLIVIPGSNDVILAMIKEGLAEKFIKAGAVISPPTCGPCIGGHMGILSENETGLYTTNRNFVGRNGHTTSKVYLSGPAVAAASALTGNITTPDSLGL